MFFFNTGIHVIKKKAIDVPESIGVNIRAYVTVLAAFATWEENEEIGEIIYSYAAPDITDVTYDGNANEISVQGYFHVYCLACVLFETLLLCFLIGDILKKKFWTHLFYKINFQ